MKEATVVENREKYIGGSDIPIIMGISPFKTRFQLLLEKAGIVEDTFTGNEYTEYGNIMESKIRDYINQSAEKKFSPHCLINGNYRCNTDGFNDKDTILEIKTTSQIHDNVDEYKIYLVQLLFYLYNYKMKKGRLDVYERPVDFNTTFDPDRLHEYFINTKDYKDLTETILDEVERFLVDLEKVKANPFITEEELQPKELIELSYQVLDLEVQLASYEKIQEKYQEIKQRLFSTMVENNIKKWTTNNGIQITRVDEILPTITKEFVFDEKKFKEDNQPLYDMYLVEQEKIKKGRSGYVKITLPR